MRNGQAAGSGVMRKIFNIPVDTVVPSPEALLRHQGIPVGVEANERTLNMASEAISVFRRLAFPTGVIMELPKESFRDIFAGEGNNETDSPVEKIIDRSDDLALFAVTVEEDICAEIARLFAENDFALGSMLDAAASEGTERAAQSIEDIYTTHLGNIGRLPAGWWVSRFSPGYCGWHVSGQRKLFRHLTPADVGISLRDSFLMEPLKSISGVIISGKKEIFRFDDSFSFCGACAAHECRDRISAMEKS